MQRIRTLDLSPSVAIWPSDWPLEFQNALFAIIALIEQIEGMIWLDRKIRSTILIEWFDYVYCFSWWKKDLTIELVQKFHK